MELQARDRNALSIGNRRLKQGIDAASGEGSLAYGKDAGVSATVLRGTHLAE